MNNNKPVNYYAKWTDDLDNEIIEYINLNLTTSEIAERMGRTNGSIRSRIKKLVYDFHAKNMSNDDICKKMKISTEYLQEILDMYKAINEKKTEKRVEKSIEKPIEKNTDKSGKYSIDDIMKILSILDNKIDNIQKNLDSKDMIYYSNILSTIKSSDNNN